VLTVFAAASLRDAVPALADAYARVEPGVRVRMSLDASSALRVQIEQGAPADLFLSADDRQPQVLAATGLAREPVAFARSRVVVVVPARSGARVTRTFDLAASGVRIVAAGADVPISGYADELVRGIASLPGAPAGFADAYARNIVSREDNVRAVLAKVALGEGDAGIVYATDVVGADVRELPLPREVRVFATYAGVVVARSANAEAAAAFLGWITGREGQAVLADLGFERVTP
jgi:molybdate transport system substrate-binding protein